MTEKGAGDAAISRPASSAKGDVPSLSRCLLTGGIGFCLASLCVFATVAFGEGWLYAHLGVAGAYLVWTGLFILLGGLALSPLVVRRETLPRFFLLFGLAFLAYAVGWISAYFLLRGLMGEWVGSLAGSVLMALVFAIGNRAPRKAPLLSAVLFAANSAGYFAGSALNAAVGAALGMTLWGGVYGLCLGAGLGLSLYLLQK